ncbi:MAG: hypothetical protein U0271_03500 [Polyangiaceae bacterium]
MRRRFAAAMALPAVAGIAASCASKAPPPRLPDDPTQLTKPLPDEYVRRAELPNGAWSVEYVETEPQERDHLPTCSHGVFCVAGAQPGAQGNAPDPYATCAAQVPYPHVSDPNAQPGGPAWVGGPDINNVSESYWIQFAPVWTAHERLAKKPETCCYQWVEPCPGGRPLRDEGGSAIVAPLLRDDGSSVAPSRAERWARAAQAEHASIASFAVFALELLALGAPLDLIARAQRAALDEVAHTELALALASDFGGRVDGLGALDVAAAPSLGAVTAARVARSTFRDGCIAESAAALEARLELESGEATTIAEARTLSRIADEEETHAQLAFETLAWLLTTFGEPVRTALEEELAAEHTSHAGRAIAVPCVAALLASHSASRPGRASLVA